MPKTIENPVVTEKRNEQLERINFLRKHLVCLEGETLNVRPVGELNFRCNFFVSEPTGIPGLMDRHIARSCFVTCTKNEAGEMEMTNLTK